MTKWCCPMVLWWGYWKNMAVSTCDLHMYTPCSLISVVGEFGRYNSLSWRRKLWSIYEQIKNIFTYMYASIWILLWLVANIGNYGHNVTRLNAKLVTLLHVTREIYYVYLWRNVWINRVRFRDGVILATYVIVHTTLGTSLQITLNTALCFASITQLILILSSVSISWIIISVQ